MCSLTLNNLRGTFKISQDKLVQPRQRQVIVGATTHPNSLAQKNTSTCLHLIRGDQKLCVSVISVLIITTQQFIIQAWCVKSDLVLRLPVDGCNVFIQSKSNCRIVIRETIRLSFEKEQVKNTQRGMHTVHHPAPSSSANPPAHLHGCMRSQTHSIIHPKTHTHTHTHCTLSPSAPLEIRSPQGGTVLQLAANKTESVKSNIMGLERRILIEGKGDGEQHACIL